MASSAEKELPVLDQKGAAEEPASTSYDQSLFVAFKKLKMDAEGRLCAKKSEDRSQATLRHKADAGDGSATEEGQPAGDDQGTAAGPLANGDEDWTQWLHRFCFCEEGATRRKGRRSWRSMCRYHRLRAKKGDQARDRGGSPGLMGAWHAHKPLLRESKLKTVEEEDRREVVRPARFRFRSADAGFNFVKPGAEVPFGLKGDAETAVKPLVCVGPLSPPLLSNGSRLPGLDRLSCNRKSMKSVNAEESQTSEQAFASQTSQRLQTFSSLAPAAAEACTPNQQAPNFQGHRAGLQFPIRNVSGLPEEGDSFLHGGFGQGSTATTSGPIAQRLRLDRPVERSCSQEARLEESDINVNELAGYFDNFLYLPKDMSSMAQMMYT